MPGTTLVDVFGQYTERGNSHEKSAEIGTPLSRDCLIAQAHRPEDRSLGGGAPSTLLTMRRDGLRACLVIFTRASLSLGGCPAPLVRWCRSLEEVIRAGHQIGSLDSLELARSRFETDLDELPGMWTSDRGRRADQPSRATESARRERARFEQRRPRCEPSPL